MKVSRLIDRTLGHRTYTWIQTAGFKIQGPEYGIKDTRYRYRIQLHDTNAGYRCRKRMQDTDG